MCRIDILLKLTQSIYMLTSLYLFSKINSYFKVRMQSQFNYYKLPQQQKNSMFPNHFQSWCFSFYPQINTYQILKNSVFNQWTQISTLLQNQKTLQNGLSCFKQCKTQTSQDCTFKTNKNLLNSCKVNQALEIFKQYVQKKQIHKKIQIIHSLNQRQSKIQNLEQEEVHLLGKKKYSQTKNIIKNYGKSILTFARKNRKFVNSLLAQFSVVQKQFWTALQQFKCKINTIAQLKHFWTFDNNEQLAKIFRILSHNYLRKYSLQHVFSSRVKNYPVHIKYRKRLLKALQNPQQFTSIKASDF